MRKILLITLLFAGMMVQAQDSLSSESCYAYFKYKENTQVLPILPATAIDFYDQSRGDVVEWLWDFGNGYTSSEQNPMFLFNHEIYINGESQMADPYRMVSLTVLTSDGCKSSYADTIDIYQWVKPPQQDDCKAYFKYMRLADDSIDETVTFELTNYSKGDSLSYHWQFNNEQSSALENPDVTYDYSRPNQEICLTVSNEAGCIDTYCEVVNVFLSDSVYPLPVDTLYPNCFVEFRYLVNYDVQTLLPALVLDFYAKADGKVESWFWDFGDGYTSDEQNPMHIFNYPIVEDSILGDPNPFREVCLTITTVDGCKSKYCETINVYMNTKPEEPQCQVWFKYYIPTDVVTIPELVPYQFTSKADGDVMNWFWQFEDGTTSSEAEPLVLFDGFKPTQEVCLTITTADSCTSTLCEMINISAAIIDTVPVSDECNYIIRFISEYPPTASSCIGKATAQVYQGDSLVIPEWVSWSNGTEGPDAEHLCPTERYSVKIGVAEGCILTNSFIFNSDGTITETPVNWWVNNRDDDAYIEYVVTDSSYQVEWVLCDGSIVAADSIPVDLIDCEDSGFNLLLKDSDGNVVYSEAVSVRSKTNSEQQRAPEANFILYPNPVDGVLNVYFQGKIMEQARFEVSDLNGRTLFSQNLNSDHSGLNVCLDVSFLESGIYIGKIVSANRIVALRKFWK